MDPTGTGRFFMTFTAVREKSEEFVEKKIEEYKLAIEEHTTWLEEILIEVKKSFASPKIQVLPKTPSAKRARKRRKAACTDSDEEGDHDRYCPPSKSRNTNTDESGRPSRSSRATRSTRATRSSTRSTRSQNQTLSDSSIERGPVMCLHREQERIEEVCEPTPTPKKTVFSVLNNSGTIGSPKNKTLVIDSDCEMQISATSRTPPNTESQKSVTFDAFTGLRATPKTLTKNTPPKSPRFISGFAGLNVKEQAKAYEQMVSSSDEATPKMDRVKALKVITVTPSVCGSDSEYGTPSSTADSPMRLGDLKTPEQESQTPATPTTAIHVTQTPPTVTYKSNASLTLSNENPKKAKSRILTQIPSASVSSAEKPIKRRSSVRESARRSSVLKSSRLSMRAGLRRSRMSLNKRKSSIMHYQAPSVASALEEIVQSPKVEEHEEEEVIMVSPKVTKKACDDVFGTPGTPRQPGLKLRLKKINKATPTESPQPAPRRTTRTKTRQMASSMSSISSSDGVFSPTAAPKLTGRPTRTKSRKPTSSAASSSTGGSVTSPPAPGRRVTRSKLRSAKSTTDLSDSQSGENEVYAPEASTRVTRTKARKRQHTDSSDSAPEPPPENKRRKSVKNVQSPILIEDSSEEELSGKSAPEVFIATSSDEDEDEQRAPAKSAFHTPTHPSSFLNALKKTKGSGSGSGTRMQGNLNGLVSSFIKRNTPKNKTALEKREEQKKEFLKKKQQQEDRIQRIREQRKKEVEQTRKKREEHMKKVLEKKKLQEKELQANSKRTVEKTREKVAITIQIREAKERAEREKLQKMREKKLIEIEERKRQEEIMRAQKQKEKEEEERRHQEMLQRKREFEEKERAVKLQEEKRLQEQKKRELEEQKLREQEQSRKQQEELEKQRRKEQDEREKQLAKERSERAQQELERKKEKERKEKEELEKKRIQLQQQLAEEKAEQEELERQRKEQEKLKAAIKQTNQSASHSSLNTSVNNSIYNTSKLNTTFEKDKNVSSDSYPMTPQGKSRGDNYNIEDMDSGDSTDDEDKPRKEIPIWATGASLKASLLSQYYRPPDVDELFGYSDMPDLTILFSRYRQKTRFKKRTSSAVWDSPLYKSPK